MEDAMAGREAGETAGRPLPPVPADTTLKIWDPFVRAFHWLLVGGLAANYFELVRAGKFAHQAIGYAVLGLVAARILWGLIGTRHARFRDFVEAPHQIVAHLRQMTTHRDPRHLGHNPAGGAMVLALLLVTLLVGASGWLCRTDWFFGVKWVKEAHEVLANALLALAVVHIVGVLHACWRHRENLVLSMVTGRKRR